METKSEAPTSWGPPLEQDMGRTLALGLGLWIGLIGAVTATGVLAAFDAQERAALGAFGAIFALAAYKLDEEMGRFVRASRSLWVAVSIFDAAVGIALLTHATGVLLAAAPLALAAHLALYDRGLLARAASPLRSPEAKSPGARPAAT